MAGTGVGKFSSTAGNNTDNLTVNFAENMAPSNVNNAARELMGHIRDMYEQLGDGYFEFGDGDKDYTIARVDADTLTIASSADLSAIYFAGRKIRVTDGGANVVEGTIASTSHGSSLQTVNLTGISLASGTPTKVELGIDTAAFGGKLILDDDGDTYIEAPTDDTIDIYVAGAKDFVITANTFTAESGSTIAAQALTATTITTTGAIAIANDGNIGSAGDADAIAISSSGVVTFSQAPVFPDGSIAVADLDIDGATDIGADIVDADLFIIDDGAGGTNRKVTASRLKTYAGVSLPGIDDQSSSNDDQLTITDTAVIINEDSDDVDFRVESNGNANAFFVDGGDSRVGINTATVNVATLHVEEASSGFHMLNMDHTLSGSGNIFGIRVNFAGKTVDDNTSRFFQGLDAGAVRVSIFSDGDIVNHDNSYGAISDSRIKSNIVDANSQWDDIKALKVRNYKKNDDIAQYGDSAGVEIGVIAQELEASSMNKLVKQETLYEATDAEVLNGDKNAGDIRDYKSVKYSVLYMKAIKALQEAQTRIETLETKVTALEG